MKYTNAENEHHTENLSLYQMDCMELLKQTPDNYYDLAITDPPYGIGIAKNPVRQQHEKKQWDSAIPQKEYFTELVRVSKNQIIWGGNYFIEHLGSSQGFFIWDKIQPHDFSLAMCEFAWSSIQKPAKIFRRSVLKDKNKIHCTQKPIELYAWIFENNAEKGQKILDTHLGSMSSAIACHYYGAHLTGCELDADYFKAGVERVEAETRQLTLF